MASISRIGSDELVAGLQEESGRSILTLAVKDGGQCDD